MNLRLRISRIVHHVTVQYTTQYFAGLNLQTHTLFSDLEVQSVFAINTIYYRKYENLISNKKELVRSVQHNIVYTK